MVKTLKRDGGVSINRLCNDEKFEKVWEVTIRDAKIRGEATVFANRAYVCFDGYYAQGELIRCEDLI